MIFENTHPYWSIRDLVQGESNVEFLTISYYFYRPQSLVDERQVFRIGREEFLDVNKMERRINSCPDKFEVAIHSIVIFQDASIRHIPMIDMSTGARAHLDKLRAFIGEHLFTKFIFFESGRSFHGYGDTLLSEREWIAFMGTLLLSNQKDLKPTVDPRWVGHRLIAGYSTLRWTKNTDQYISIPRKLHQT